MTDLERLEGAFAAGELVSPLGPGPRLPDLSRALYGLAGLPAATLAKAGAKGAALTSEALELQRLIGPAEHYVLVLVDGLGDAMLARAPEGGFLRERRAGSLRTVWPSTTAAALTALATGEWPGRHAVPGWWVWLDPPGLSAEVVPFVERFGRRPLGEHGVRPEEVFTVPSAVARLGHEPLAIMPAEIAGSVYSRYCAGGTATAGYKAQAEAFDLAAARVLAAARPSFTYVYVPHVDGACHDHGVGSPQAIGLLEQFDRLLDAFAERLGGRARIVVTGDHGLVDIPPERSLFIDEGDPLLDLLRWCPNGESTALLLHVRPGREEAFAAGFRERYGEFFGLLSAGEAESLGLFGPEGLSELARARVGDFVTVAWRPAALYYRARQGKVHVHRASHAGLSPDEMLVPLVLA